MDAVGHAAVIANCVKAADDFGQVVLLGSPRVPYEANLTEVFGDIHVKGLTVKGAHMWRYPLQQQRGCSMSVEWTFETLLELIGTGALDVKPLISHVVKPSEVPAAYEGLLHRPSEYLCVVIDWREHGVEV